MPFLKRKAQHDSDDSEPDGSCDNEQDFSDDAVDIANALSGRHSSDQGKDDDSDDDLKDFILQSIAKRDAKAGTEIVKKIKKLGKSLKGEVGGGSFQSMGLHPWLLRSLTLQGYRIPTPIQRLSIPILFANPIRDLVGMARTGSGKTLAYMVPLVQRLGGRHATTFGARALILIPTRELAVQILKVGKGLVRGWSSHSGIHAGDKEAEEKGNGLRWSLIVGGESMDEQFEMIASNPDIIIATPGRLLHLIVEMNLDLKSVQYVVFDEADRLFEMGFEIAMTEIIQRLPPTRQSILFSATLPKSLVEFAKAGLNNPKLVRLDAESKINPDLRMAFFSVKQTEKEACLLSLLRDVIKVPLGPSLQVPLTGGRANSDHAAAHQTLVFVATKHHVEFVTSLLTAAGYAVSHLYGFLDQAARTSQMDRFRKGFTRILVVTDVAARGIDIPVLENVVNYDFPQSARVFVHRVGRTARAGRQGWAWSLVSNTELPHLLDLQLFLGRPLTNVVPEDSEQPFTESLVIGTFDRTKLDEDVEYIHTLEETSHLLSSLRDVMKRGHALYERSKGKASPQSYKRAKEMMKDPKWSLADSSSRIHPVLLRETGTKQKSNAEARQALLRSVNSFKPSETVLEVAGRATALNSALMKQRKMALNKSAQRRTLGSMSTITRSEPMTLSDSRDHEVADDDIMDISGVSEGPLYRDSEFYMSYQQRDAAAEKGYSLTDNAPFAQQAERAIFDLLGDESALSRRKRQLNWDKKKKRFIKGHNAGADNIKLIRTESGAKLPATYRSGRFDEWKIRTKVNVPRVGEAENEYHARRQEMFGAKRFKHNTSTLPKPLDKLHKGYERKVRQMKKRDIGAKSSLPPAPEQKVKSPSRYSRKTVGRVKMELKTVDQIRKTRKITEKRRAKNARPNQRKSRH